MCKECGCNGLNGNARVQFSVKGYTEETARLAETALLGLKGVLYVHIHSLSGATEIDYNPKKTRLMEIYDAFTRCGLEAEL